jgi:hypothetical protein
MEAKPPAVAAFAYSKDWLVTESHRLSFYHVQNAPAEGLIPGGRGECKKEKNGERI